MKYVAISIIGLLLAAPASAATIASATSGAWSSASTWTGGAVPGSGDWAQVSSGTTVSVSGTIEADSLLVAGTVLTSGDTRAKIGKIRVIAGTLTVAAGDSLIQAAAAPSVTPALKFGGGAGVWLHVSTLGTLNVYGNLAAVGSYVDSNFGDRIIYGSLNSTVNVQGDATSTANVQSILSNSAAPKQRVTLNVDPGSATHLQLLNGWHRGAIYKIESSSGTEVLLTKGRLGVRKLGSRAAGVDSVHVVESPDSLEVVLGAVALFGDGSDDWTAGGKRVNSAFDNGDSLALYFDDEHALTAAEAASDSLYLSEALFPGASVQLFRAATIAGDIEGPDSWPSTASGPDSTVSQGIWLDGTVDIDYAHIHNLSGGAGNSIIASTAGTFDMDRTYLSDTLGGYMLSIVQGGTDDGKTLNLSWLYLDNNVKKFDNGSDGHGIENSDDDDEDIVVIQYSGARRLTDDFMYYRQGAGGGVYDSWMTQSNGNCAFVDFQANASSTAGSYRLERNWVVGAGDNAFQFDGSNGTAAVRQLVSKDNLFSRPQIKWNRTTNVTSVNTATDLFAIAITDPVAFTSERDTLQWALGGGWTTGMAATLVSGAADSVYFKRGVMRNIGFVQGNRGTTPTSTMGSGIGLNITTSNGFAVIIESCIFRDIGSRGNMSGFGTRSNYGVGCRDNAAIHIRRCLFDGSHNATSKDPDVYVDGSTVLLYVSHSKFVGDDNEEAAIQVASNTDFQAWRNLFTGYGPRFCLYTAGDTGSVIRFNTFFVDPSGKRSLEGLIGPTIVGNLFLNRSQSNQFIRFTAAADTTGSVIDWNIYRTQASSFAVIAAATQTTANWGNSYDANGSVVVSSGATVRNIALREGLPRLTSTPDTTSVAIDFITDTGVMIDGGTTDADGSVLDAGATPKLREW